VNKPPSFTAEDSVYRTSLSYRGAYGVSRSAASGVIAQQDVGRCFEECIIACDPGPGPRPRCSTGRCDGENFCCSGYHCCEDTYCLPNHMSCF
jgi:hypothetical protein